MAKFEISEYPITKTERSNERFFQMLNTKAKQDFEKLIFIDSEGEIIYSTSGRLYPNQVINEVKNNMVSGREIAGLLKYKDPRSCVLYLRTDINIEKKYLPYSDPMDKTNKAGEIMSPSNTSAEENHLEIKNDNQCVKFEPKIYPFTKIERSKIRLKTMASSATNQEFIELSFINSEGLIIFKTNGKTNPRKYLSIVKQKLNNSSYLSGLIKWQSSGSCVLYISDNFKLANEPIKNTGQNINDDEELIESITSTEYATIFNEEIDFSESLDQTSTNNKKQLPTVTEPNISNDAKNKSEPNIIIYLIIFIVIVIILKSLAS